MNAGVEDIEQRLSVALHEVAAQVRVSTHNETLAEPSRRAARWSKRPLAIAFAVLIAVLVTATVALQLHHEDSERVDSAPAATNSKEIPAGNLVPDEADVVAYMTIRASAEQIAEVRSLLSASHRVKRFAFLDQDANYRVFKKIFQKDRDLTQNVDPESLPTSFLVFTRSCGDRAPLSAELSSAIGVDQVQPAPGLTHSQALKALPRSRTGKTVAPVRCRSS